ncbi:MAG: hypothetical protein CVT92_00390 [Bacteroidetes bacterium HGW-Bacteroidetes-1]|jgi:antitoxin component YwqK of YwqJK toxin-antitoxin module|nr:MAG: hypothetical protein CVT92_00390 [Bacteroidetes bacterium HGW-Bacteroidetes-1]
MYPMKELKMIVVFVMLFCNMLLFGQKPVDVNQTDANEKKTGYWEGRFPSGIVRYAGQFYNDKPIGEFKYYFESGKLRAINDFTSNGLKAYNKTFTESGILIAEGIYLDQKKDSLWKFYNDVDGSLLSEEIFKNNNLNGISKNYYPKSNQVAETIEYLNGQKYGVWRVFFEDGTLQSEGNYQEGQFFGKYTEYYPNGLIKSQGNYENGYKNGVWQTFDDEGNLLSEDVHKSENP